MKTKKCLAAAIFLGIILGGCAAVPEKDELASLEQTLNLALSHKAPVVTAPKKPTRILPNPALSPAPVTSAPAPATPNLATQKRQEEFEREIKARADVSEKAFKDQLGKVNGKAEDALRGVERIEATKQPVQQVIEKPASDWSLSYILLWTAVIMLIADRLRQWWRCRQSIDIPETDVEQLKVDEAIPQTPLDEPELDAAIPPSPPDEPPVEEIPLPAINTSDDVAVEAAPPVRPVLLTPPPPQRGVPPTMKPMLPRRPMTQSNEEGGTEQ